MINVQNQQYGIANTPTESKGTREGPASADVRAFERMLNERPAGDVAAQRRWQDNAGPINERVRPDASPGEARSVSPDSLFSMHAKAETPAMSRGAAANPTPETTGRAVHDLETGGLMHRDPQTRDAAADPMQASVRGSDFIDALFRGAPMPGTPMQTGDAGNVRGAAMPDGEALEALVSRILVNTPEKGGSEVRLTLNESAFRGTEVSLLRDASGALTVKIVSADPSAFQTLVSSRNELVSALQATEEAPVTVSMEEERSDGNDSRQRSRGLDELDADGGR